ncbi:hypothetical protein GE061_003473 [Apolygus lucorum]|uniref:Odorant receptor n=1 Tax=Apolygus lucorum TaxID=248454 RepID=A0A6A4JMT0_APOLU|nr:hypothetical protein GE061_003473 [Apolygus lucorum]QQP20018.1 olfactory receptor 16 [Apolygus lucorum]
MSGDISRFKAKSTTTNESLMREEYIRKGIDENNGLFLIIGGMYTGYLPISILHAILTAVHIPLLLAAVIIGRNDYVVVSETIHFIILLSLAFVISMRYLSVRKKLDNIFEAMGRGYYNYEGTLDPGTEKEFAIHLKESEKRKSVLKYVFVGGCIGALICVSILRPVLQYYFKKYIKSKKLPHGLNGAKNTFIYYPWDSSNTWLNFIGYFLQDAYTLMTANVVFGFVLMFVSTAESVVVQLDKLKLSLKRIKIRAAFIASINHEDPATNNNKDFRRALHICIKHSIKHHQLISRIFDDFKSINYLSLFYLIGSLTFLLCMSAVLFAADDVSLISKATFVFFITSELVATFLVCMYGEHIAGMSSSLPMDLYNTEWYHFSNELLIYYRMLAMRCTRPCQLTAGGFSQINRNTFLEVLKTAFSYANLLQASKQK